MLALLCRPCQRREQLRNQLVCRRKRPRSVGQLLCMIYFVSLEHRFPSQVPHLELPVTLMNTPMPCRRAAADWRRPDAAQLSALQSRSAALLERWPTQRPCHVGELALAHAVLASIQRREELRIWYAGRHQRPCREGSPCYVERPCIVIAPRKKNPRVPWHSIRGGYLKRAWMEEVIDEVPTLSGNCRGHSLQ